MPRSIDNVVAQLGENSELFSNLVTFLRNSERGMPASNYRESDEDLGSYTPATHSIAINPAMVTPGYSSQLPEVVSHEFTHAADQALSNLNSRINQSTPLLQRPNQLQQQFQSNFGKFQASLARSKRTPDTADDYKGSPPELVARAVAGVVAPGKSQSQHFSPTTAAEFAQLLDLAMRVQNDFFLNNPQPGRR